MDRWTCCSGLTQRFVPLQTPRKRQPIDKIFDVLFLGAYTPRRMEVLNKITTLGMTVEVVTPLDYGHFEYTPLWELSERIRLAKVVHAPISTLPRGNF